MFQSGGNAAHGILRSMIWARRGGSEDGPLLVLLHGLGATADVFLGMEERLPGSWSGGWLAVDLPGHGRSDWAPPYTFADHARQLAEIVPDDRELVLLGHSMGAMVAMELAALRPRTSTVVGFSVKTWWPDDHIEGAQRQARREPVVFEERSQAVDRYLKIAGLVGLVDLEDAAVASGVTEVDGGWRVAQDPRTFDFGRPDMRAAVGGLAARLVLARGSEDHLVRDTDVADYVADPVTLDGLGHNPHVEDPAAVVALLAR